MDLTAKELNNVEKVNGEEKYQMWTIFWEKELMDVFQGWKPNQSW